MAEVAELEEGLHLGARVAVRALGALRREAHRDQSPRHDVGQVEVEAILLEAALVEAHLPAQPAQPSAAPPSASTEFCAGRILCWAVLRTFLYWRWAVLSHPRCGPAAEKGDDIARTRH